MPKYNSPRRTWVYSNEFKHKAVKLTLQPDTKVKDIAEGLGIHPMMLSRWRSEYRQGVLQGDGQRLNRFSLRGKRKVQGQWQLYCLVHNIEKLMNYGMVA